jgi:hypothetical protein
VAVSVALMLLGCFVGGVAAVMVVSPFVDLYSTRTVVVPGRVDLDIGRGTYQVFAHQLGSDGPTLTASDLSVTSPAGSSITLSNVSGYSIVRGGDTYDAIVEFYAPAKGHYTLDVDPNAGQASVFVARPIGDIARSVRWWALTFLAAGLVFGAGLIMLVVGIVRRHHVAPVVPTARAGSAAASPASQVWWSWPPGAPAPAGWYPDPGQPHRWRWWDGATWTQHVH